MDPFGGFLHVTLLLPHQPRRLRRRDPPLRHHRHPDRVGRMTHQDRRSAPERHNFLAYQSTFSDGRVQAVASRVDVVVLARPVLPWDFRGGVQDGDKKVRQYKKEIVSIIHEYILSDDIPKLQSLEDLAVPEYNPIFLEKLITLAMDRKNCEKEIAFVLLSVLHIEGRDR